ncbi:MAG: ABC transporter permease [Bacteroidetes bacterium]|nr:ABC transporter permease [Bacteroidota bacterium]MBU1115880.1 ABC transporter permease [Bacteroidota bacterium]MBU1797994.1 ABC transporter permease [Bacteroidota bacterium]
MKKLDLFKIGLEELNANKLRTFLTMLGIIFGVASVIAMLSIGEGARRETLEQIELLGSNNIIIKSEMSEVNEKEPTSFSPGLTLDDLTAIKNICPFIISLTPQRESLEKIVYKSNILEANIIGTTTNYPTTFNSNLESGNFFNKQHMERYANVCVIGADIKTQLFKYKDPINEKIKIGDFWFTIIGVISAKKNLVENTPSTNFRNFNQDVYIPLSTMNYKMDKYIDPSKRNEINWLDIGKIANAIDRKTINQLTVKVTGDDKIVIVAGIIKRILTRKHYAVLDYRIIIPEEIMAQKQKTQNIFNIVMGAIAGISLLVGGIGIMNIMLANIMERTKEIGIRRAVGATRQNVLNQFIFEALTISFIGGLLGILTGFILTSIISNYADWRTIITPSSIILAFFVSVMVGFIFGSYPAKKAAEKDPIDALRYE